MNHSESLSSPRPEPRRARDPNDVGRAWVPTLVGIVLALATWLALHILGSELALDARHHGDPDGGFFGGLTWRLLAPLFAIGLGLGAMSMGITWSRRRARAQRRLELERAINIAAAPEDLYLMWRHARILDHIFGDLADVAEVAPRRQRWTLRGPSRRWTWEAEIVADRPGELIAWRTSAADDLPNDGWIHFARHARGTEVQLHMNFQPPGRDDGEERVGEVITRTAIDNVLRRFKSLVETGEIPILVPTR